MKQPADNPILLIIGGPNGAGKTTFAREYLTREMKGLRFLNTDEIARGLSPFDVDSVAFKAGRIFLEEVKGEIAEGNSLAIESTLSGKAHAKIIRDAKSSGYLIRIHFLWIPSAKFSRKRVTQRTKQGGHDVPTDAIQRRFPRIFRNLLDLYLPLADEWSLWDSSERPAKLLADIQNTLFLRLENFSSKMINHRKITREGLKPSEMSAESKLALRAMRRAGKKVVEDYRRLGLKLVVTDKDGKMVLRDA